MTITLRPDQEAWLRTQVAKGDFVSIEAAARQLLDQKIAELADAEGEASDDLAWAKPYVDEARSAVARGEVISLEEYEALTSALLASLRV
jgi:antitoxin ParD1/3/4